MSRETKTLYVFLKKGHKKGKTSTSFHKNVTGNEKLVRETEKILQEGQKICVEAKTLRLLANNFRGDKNSQLIVQTFSWKQNNSAY